jgi:FkbM family methyltransferase
MSGHADSVICFEPFEPVRRRLEERIVRNHVRNVSVWPLALSAQAGTALYYPPEGSNQGVGSLVPELSANSSSAPIAVKIDIGDNYFSDHLNTGITILKIDVEGSELDVLEGFRKTLAQYRPAVILELSKYTRAKAGGLAQLTELIYPDANVFTIGKTAWRVDYKLKECKFGASELDNILIIPSELSAVIPRSASFASVAACPPSFADCHVA